MRMRGLPPGISTRIRALASPATMRALRLAFLVVAVGLSVYAVVTRWDEVSHHLQQIGWMRAILCVPAMLAGLICGMRAWRSILTGLGSDLSTRPAARIYFVGQLGKYLPGSVWPVLAQMELGRDHDVPRRRSAGALVVAIVVSLATALIITGVTIPFVDGARHPALWRLVAAVPVCAALLVPRVLWACLRRVPVLKLGSTLPPVLPNRAMAAAAAWATLGWLSYGAHVALLAAAFDVHGTATLLVASLGGYALAWSAGLMAFVLPAGAGARDVTLVLALSAVLPTNPAIAVAVVSRVVTTVCDLALAASAGAVSAATSARHLAAKSDAESRVAVHAAVD
jgi:glycosyltransferase 2 family protein